MTAPDLDELENIANSLDEAVSCMYVIAMHLGHIEAGDPTLWVIGKIKQDAEALGDWFERAHRANVVNKRTGPVAVT